MVPLYYYYYYQYHYFLMMTTKKMTKIILIIIMPILLLLLLSFSLFFNDDNKKDDNNNDNAYTTTTTTVTYSQIIVFICDKYYIFFKCPITNKQCRSVIDSRQVDAPLDMTLSIVASIRQPYRCDRIDKIKSQMPLPLERCGGVAESKTHPVMLKWPISGDYSRLLLVAFLQFYLIVTGCHVQRAEEGTSCKGVETILYVG